MKKGQIDMVFFMVLAVMIIIIAPIMMTVFRTAVGGFSDGLANVNSGAAATVDVIENKFIGFYDILVVCVLLVNILMLFIMAFLVDVHPAFLMFYILTCVFSMIFIPVLLETAENIWTADTISGYTSSLPMTQFFLDNYSIIMLIVMVITGIITYAKIRGYQQGGFQ